MNEESSEGGGVNCEINDVGGGMNKVDVGMNKEVIDLIDNAEKVYLDNFDGKVWFGRCIFLSWYCDVGTCKFCYRSTIKDRIKHAKHARRSLHSVIVEALLAKKFDWRLEFLTGGYKIFSMDELVDICKIVSKVFGEDVWLNLGALDKEDLEKFKPYIDGIVSSIETVDSKLHDEICPNKPIKPYREMFRNADGLKKSMTMIVGLGEKRLDFKLLKEFISEYNLDRITFYALKPVKDTPYTVGPSVEDYVWWIAQTRIAFPKIEIIAGTTLRRVKENKNEIYYLMKAGVNAITKFPITKAFGGDECKSIVEQISRSGRNLTSEMLSVGEIDWDVEIEKLGLDDELKGRVIETLKSYLARMSKN